MTPPHRLLLLAGFTVTLLLSCGGGGTAQPGLPPTSGDSGGSGDSGSPDPGSPPPPPPPGGPDQPIFDEGDLDEGEGGVAGFSTDLDDTENTPPGTSLVGMVNWQFTPNLVSMVTDSGGGGGVYRMNLRLNAPASKLGQQLALAEAAGMQLWLNVAGTPLELSDITASETAYGLPPYARRVPTDIDAWAQLVVDALQDMQNDHGFLPDYVEIWNEPDREEFFDGSLEDYLAIYAATSVAVKNAFPSVKVGGMALAGSDSTMGGNDSALFSLIDHAFDEALPLDFVSWHHYTIASGLVASGIVGDLRDALDNADFTDATTVVSEWNMYPSPEVHGADFDSSKSAANYAGFVTSARHLGLDGNMFFMLQDNAGSAGSLDLTGLGMGALTAHGIKKPVFRLMEFMQPMAHEPVVETLRPDGELAMNVYATRSGNRVRFVVSNSVVDGDWVWTNRLREQGFTPGAMWPLFKAAAWEHGDHHPPRSLMLAHGLTGAEADAITALIPELEDAWEDAVEPETVDIVVSTAGIPTLGDVWLFEAGTNDPAAAQETLQPQIALSEDAARLAAFDVVADFLTGEGTPTTGAELAAAVDVYQWAIDEGVSEQDSLAAEELYFDTLDDTRLMDEGLLNALPQTALQAMTAAEAGISLVDGVLSVTLGPDSVVVFDVLL